MVNDLTGVSRTILCGIRDGTRKRCRKQTQDKILGVTIQPWSDAHLVDATETWRMLDELLSQGWTKTELARRLGSKAKTPALQLNRTIVTARNALRVKRLYKQLKESPCLSLNYPGTTY
jgi:hypothetical protein